ncbi:MAG: aldolase [Dehalococcoidia bacterium]|nr:aldolase [Dehalococcoidia bacterium]
MTTELAQTLTAIHIPADVPASQAAAYEANLRLVTKDTGRLVLFAGDQKVEHLNDDFYGSTKTGPIAEEDADPEHLFRIAQQGVVGCFATQLGLVARYGPDYTDVPYLVKVNSKTHLIPTAQGDPRSRDWVTLEQVESLRDAGLNIVGVGYTVYPGSEFESEQMAGAAQVCYEAHRRGMLAVLWVYPRGAAVADERDPHLIAGCAGLAAALGADFCKVNYPKVATGNVAEAFRESARAAGRTRLITAGGEGTGVESFLQTLHDQIFISGAKGSATGRNIHQKPLPEALRMTQAISAITYGGWSVPDAVSVFNGDRDFVI